jgi:prophage regulatory protein
METISTPLAAHGARHPERLIPLPEVCDRTGICRTAVYNYISAGTFPKPRKIGKRSRWVSSEVDRWVSSVAKSAASA